MENISISMITPNEKNPRKTLDNLEELADSIKSNGIMQQLTVVKDGEKYVVVIGHRRLAAAKLAGLKEVPCEVKELTLKEQVQIMLMENMQRSDLTITEQSKGIQTCLDLGIKEADIVKKTGLSKTTIKNRVLLNKFDLNEVQKKLDAGAKLDDYVKVNKIVNDEAQKELLKHIGTSSFEWKFNELYNKQERPIWYKKFKEDCISYRVKSMEQEEYEGLNDDRKFYKFEKCVRYPVKFSKELCKTNTLVVFDDNDQSFDFYLHHAVLKKEKHDSIIDEWEIRKKLRNEKEKIIKPLFERAYLLRIEFMRYSLKTQLTLTPAILDAIYNLISRILIFGDAEILVYFNLDGNLFNELYQKNDDVTEREEFVLSQNDALVHVLYYALEFEYEDCVNADYEFDEDEVRKYLFELLKILGYRQSPEEKSLFDGTHEVYEQIKKITSESIDMSEGE